MFTWLKNLFEAEKKAAEVVEIVEKVKKATPKKRAKKTAKKVVKTVKEETAKPKKPKRSYVCKDGTSKLVLVNEVKTYLDNGWKKGRKCS